MTGAAGREDEIVRLFTETFAAFEGAEEGAVIGALVAELLATTAADDLPTFCARDGAGLTGVILFIRLRFAGAARGRCS